LIDLEFTNIPVKMPEEVKTKLAGVSESSSEGVGLKSGKFVFSNGDVYEGDD
jgi:hypothetical protein